MNVVLEAIEAEDRATAERWAMAYYNATFSMARTAGWTWEDLSDEARDEKIAAMLPLVREARHDRAAALLERDSAGWAVVAQIGKALGLPEDASTQAILDAAGRLTASVDVDAEVERLANGIMQAAEPPGVAIRTWIHDTVERAARLQREVEMLRDEVCHAQSDVIDDLRAEIARLKSV